MEPSTNEPNVPRIELAAGVDPARHLLAEAWNQHVWFAPPPSPWGSTPPVPLDAHVEQWRAEIAGGVDAEPQARAAVPLPMLSHARALVLERLLHEACLRFTPGLAVGPIDTDGSLTALIDELCEDLIERSWG